MDNIRYDLLRTGNVEVTTNKVLEKGFLEAPPPAYYTVFPRTPPANANGTRNANAPGGATRAPAQAIAKQPKESLISKYGLEDRAKNPEPLNILEEQIGGKAVWEDSAAKREASLRERKAQMILAARQRLLAQQQSASTAGPSAKP